MKSAILILFTTVLLTGCMNDTAKKVDKNTEVSIKAKTEAVKSDWKTYTGFGVTISYPDDGTYKIEASKEGAESFAIAQEHPGNIFHVTVSDKIPSFVDGKELKVIEGNTYKVFHREGMGTGYGYVLERNGKFYIFESGYGPKNKVFEQMMKTVKLKDLSL